jgi:hypothetical protein
MKMLKIMSIFMIFITGHIWAMQKPSIQPISTMEWLFGYRTYTPEEQYRVDKLAKVEQESPSYIQQWLREPFKGDDEIMKRNAQKIIEFIEIKYLQNTFPKVYHEAQSLIKLLTDPEEIENLNLLKEYVRSSKPTLHPLSKANIEKGLHSGISVSNKIPGK